MLAVVEVASSGLGAESYPIAVAWAEVGAGAEGYVLIRPAAGWSQWESAAERAHGITRERLMAEGLTAAAAVQAIALALNGATCFSDSVRLDQTWLDRLFAKVPGSRAPSLRRLTELFPGADPAEIEDAIETLPVPPAPCLSLTEARRRALVAGRFMQVLGGRRAR